VNAPDPLEHGWWLASRASGIVALLLITVSVIVGLTMSTRFLGRPKLNRVLTAIHEHTSLASLVALSVHGLTLMGEKFLKPGLTGVLVPFAGDYRPVWTGLGIVGGYLAIIFGLSFYARKRIGAKLWRRMHRFTILVYVLSVIHTLGAGTDASTAWMRWMLVITGAPVLFLTLGRFLPQKPLPAGTPPTPSSLRAAGASRQAAAAAAQASTPPPAGSGGAASAPAVS
jgi:methionine sulfoxide reductase heme-binding subunit